MPDHMTDAERARENILDNAVRDRKIAASEKAQYRSKYNANPKTYRHLLTAKVEDGGLMAGIVPGDSATDSGEAYPPEWLGNTQAAPVMSEGGAPAPAATGDPAYPREWVGSLAAEPSRITVEND